MLALDFLVLSIFDPGQHNLRPICATASFVFGFLALLSYDKI